MKNEIDMVHGPLIKNVLIYGLPIMLSQLLQMLFNAADTIVVGKFAGANALAAVGCTGSIIYLIVSLFFGLSVGGNVVIATAIGAKDKDRIEKSVHTAVSLSFISGIIAIIAGIALSRTVLSLMGTPENILEDAILYMRVIFLGSIFMLIYDFGSAILRSKGDTRNPMYFLIISGILNVVLNLLFVIVFHWDVLGVALATDISHAVSAVLVLRAMMRDTGDCHLDIKKLCLNKSIVGSILRIGVPAGFQGVAFALSNVVIQSSINSFDSSTIVAGNTAAANIESFVYIGMMAFSSAAMTFTSQNIGAKNYKRIRPIMVSTMLLDIAMSFAIGIAVYLAADPLLRLYTSDPEVVKIGTLRLFYVVVFLFLNAALDILVNSLRGMGYSYSPTIIMLTGVCVFRLIYLFTYFPINPTISVIYAVYPISWVITTIVLLGEWIMIYRKRFSPLIKENAKI